MTPENWINAGYCRFESYGGLLNRNADFGLQKRFDDENGRKYFITVFVYGKLDDTRQYVFMPTVNINLGYGKPSFNIDMHGIFNIAQVEEHIEKLWVHFGRPYYAVTGNRVEREKKA